MKPANLRQDPVTGLWVVYDRDGLAPEDYAAEPDVRIAEECPFCSGHESMTPPEIAAYGGKPWKVRVVPNKFPAVSPDERPAESGKGLQLRMGGFGFHELIIESGEHNEELADAAPDQLKLVIEAYRQRWLAASRDPRVRYLMIFKNYGSLAGASLEHPHSQFIALPFIPSRAAEEFDGARAHFASARRCVWCEELGAGDREVFLNADFAVVSPFVARFPFEIMVLPRRHASDFTAMTAGEAVSFGEALRTALGKIRKRLGNPAYNFMIHALPAGKEDPAFHWHVEIIPKLTKVRAFEWGTGVYVNPTPPEAASAALRQV